MSLSLHFHRYKSIKIYHKICEKRTTISPYFCGHYSKSYIVITKTSMTILRLMMAEMYLNNWSMILLWINDVGDVLDWLSKHNIRIVISEMYLIDLSIIIKRFMMSRMINNNIRINDVENVLDWLSKNNKKINDVENVLDWFIKNNIMGLIMSEMILLEWSIIVIGLMISRSAWLIYKW